ncbi:MAG: fumarylacetoacetate hydrolase family protein, partial [Hyphomicrobiaceae bacterium]
MKLATLASEGHGRDGELVVVSSDLTVCTAASLIAPTLQAALDDWDHCQPRLMELADALKLGSVPSQRFHERD